MLFPTKPVSTHTYEERKALLAQIQRKNAFEAKLKHLFETNPKLFYMCYGKIKLVYEHMRTAEEQSVDMETFRAVQAARRLLRDKAYAFEGALR